MISLSVGTFLIGLLITSLKLSCLESEVFNKRHDLGVKRVYKLVDTCAAGTILGIFVVAFYFKNVKSNASQKL
ncbi:hypothetical protein N9K77_00940 [bacterium]|nr:hypothetical protein [bacterium]